MYGSERATVEEAVESVLQRFSDEIDPAEATRIRNLMGEDDRQPPRRGVVRMIHQIYGLYRDGQPMTKVYQESSRRWREAADATGAKYILWGADEVDTLVRRQFSIVWKAYQKSMYPAMRVAYARICILHHYGGLVADLDVDPKQGAKYRMSDLCVCVRTNSPSHSPPECQPEYHQDVLISKRDSGILVLWLEFLISETGSQPSAPHTEAIRMTTGAASLARFINLPSSQKWTTQQSATIQCLSLGAVGAAGHEHVNFISHRAPSPVSRSPAEPAAVGTLCEATLPDRPPTHRLRSKSALISPVARVMSYERMRTNYEQMRTNMLDELKFTGELCKAIFESREAVELSDPLRNKIAEVLLDEGLIADRSEF